jgi:hypothetical protein
MWGLAPLHGNRDVGFEGVKLMDRTAKASRFGSAGKLIYMKSI